MENRILILDSQVPSTLLPPCFGRNTVARLKIHIISNKSNRFLHAVFLTQ